jgi:hypothetical protein
MKLLIIMALAAIAYAQTAVSPGQLRGTVSATGQALVTMPTGGSAWALIGDGVVLDTSGTRPVLRVIPTSSVRLMRVKAVATATPAQTYSVSGVSDSSQVMVFRNGVLQADGEDYDAKGGTVTFRGSAVQQGDIIQLIAIL